MQIYISKDINWHRLARSYVCLCVFSMKQTDVGWKD